MKISVIILLTFLFSANCYSQTWTAIATSSANVIRAVSITLTGSGNLDFGEVVVTPSSQQLNISNQNGQKFLVNGQEGRNVSITYPNSITISNANWVAINGGTNSTINFNANTLVSTGVNVDYVNPVNVPSGSSINLAPLNSVGTLYLWLGGSLNIDANKPGGVYTGTFSISVSY